MIKVSQIKSSDDYRQKFFLISVIVVFLFFILAVRLWFLQILNGEKWLRFAESNRIEAKRIPAIRGRILDRYGKVIADSKPSFDLKVMPYQLKPNPEVVLQNLRTILGWSEEETAQIIEKVQKQNKNDLFTIHRDLDHNSIAILRANQFRFPGVRISVVPSRNYIHGSLGSHLLGYLGEIGKKDLQSLEQEGSDEYGLGEFWGLSGIEKIYESELKGVDGIEPVIEDVWGREVQVDSVSGLLPSFQPRSDKEGHDVVLAVDLDLQIVAEEFLKGKRGSIIAMDPRNGEILAMASSPTYEPEQFARGVESSYWRKVILDPEKPLYNRSIQGVYPPASTFKAITAMAILEERVADPNERIYCPGHYRIGRETKRCWKPEGHGSMNLKEAVQHSCDVYFYEMSRRLGINRIADYAKLFGLGQKTGFPLSGEEKGLVPNEEWKQKVYKQPWVQGETLSVGIGQGALSTTPIQMAVAFAAFANGGYLVTPQPALRIQTYDGKIIRTIAMSEGKQIEVQQDNLKRVMESLNSVVNEPGGTAYWTVRSKMVNIAGKTGTAQMVGRRHAGKIKNNAWFIGYAPDVDPEILVTAVIEEGEHGSSGAGPAAKLIIESYYTKKEQSENY